MTTKDDDFAYFDRIKEREVRRKLGSGAFGPRRIKSAREWLTLQSESEARLDKREANELAREANEFARDANDISLDSNDLAREANCIAKIAVAVAIISATIAIANVIWG